MSAQPTTSMENGAGTIEELRAEVRRLDQEVRRLAEAVQTLQQAGTVSERRSELRLPEHTVAAYEAYRAELPDLLTHMAAHPAERWVAYRGGQRLKFGTSERELGEELARTYPDGRYDVYEIDESQNYPLHDTVV